MATWQEHIFFEPKNKEAAEMEGGKLEIKLMDKGFLKDAIIGYYEFDLSYIYLMNDHAMLHKWIVMSNPDSDDIGEVTGYLKLSVTITGESDAQVQIGDDPNPDVDDIIQPPQIKPEFYQLYIRFFQAQKIVAMDTSTLGLGENKTDAYISLKYKTKTLKTSV